MKAHVIIIGIGLCCLGSGLQAQEKRLADGLPDVHPRYLTLPEGKQETLQLIEQEEWATRLLQELKARTDYYVDKGPAWLTSRLQMYWKSHATDVFVKGEDYDHAGGEKAPAPTVMFSGARSHVTNYRRPRLEDLQPYQENPLGILLANRILPDTVFEWASISKTGSIIQSLNQQIAEISRDAAFLWWLTGEPKYAEVAASVFDTYMTGIYYRNVPKDLNHGHQQTLVGMSSFEVIHENILDALVPLYDFLYDYLKREKPEKMAVYAAAFKKWADNIIDNGVPHNNWNLMQARFIMNIGLILEDDEQYADRKGRGYYIDYVMNRSSIRQWSLRQLAAYGYDPETGIWAECPGYSSVVIGDYTDFVTLFDRNLGIDLAAELPVIPKAVAATPQYLFPNRNIVGFGDTHPGPLRTDIFRRMIENARRHGKQEQERYFTSLLKMLDPKAAAVVEQPRVPVAVTSFFTNKPLVLDAKIPAGKPDDYVTPTFYAPNVSWFVQRNGMDARHSLMISQNASLGNHMHANGISMELYGKGLPLAPDAGIGQSLYAGLDYLEYYGQFPSHNTVCVNGISSYPIMKSNHAFRLLGCYPEAGEKVAYQPVSYSDVYFREPESQADQRRLMSIVTTGRESGYYVDIFRSRTVAGDDKMHDYFYHNLGQEMRLLGAADSSDLHLRPTEELAFAGAHLYAYSYLFDKRAAETSKDVRADFVVQTPDKDDITMTMWMRGDTCRTLFSALSPMTEGLTRTPGMPYDMKSQPTLTFVARQRGEAWNHPFVAIYEPSSVKEPGTIVAVSYPQVEGRGAVGIQVCHRGGRTDHILSSDQSGEVGRMGTMRLDGSYGFWSEQAGEGEMLFLGGGKELQVPGVSIRTAEAANVLLVRRNGQWLYTASHEADIRIGERAYRLKPLPNLSLIGD